VGHALACPFFPDPSVSRTLFLHARLRCSGRPFKMNHRIAVVFPAPGKTQSRSMPAAGGIDEDYFRGRNAATAAPRTAARARVGYGGGDIADVQVRRRSTSCCCRCAANQGLRIHQNEPRHADWCLPLRDSGPGRQRPALDTSNSKPERLSVGQPASEGAVIHAASLTKRLSGVGGKVAEPIIPAVTKNRWVVALKLRRAFARNSSCRPTQPPPGANVSVGLIERDSR